MARQYWIKWATALSLAGALVAACTDDKTNKPSDNLSLGGDESTGGSGAKGGSSALGGALGVAGDSTGVGGTIAQGGAMTTTDAGAAGASVTNGGAPSSAGAAGISNRAGAAGQADCVDAVKNCFKCAASSNQQILNHCTDAKCVAFDNKTLTKLVNGQLPALP
ncbi:MAG TPA: hypothetical protein VIV60_37380 [Polyangiaceae bacterium]